MRHLRAGTVKDEEDAVEEAAKAGESVMKALLQEHGAALTGKETARPLFELLSKNGIVVAETDSGDGDGASAERARWPRGGSGRKAGTEGSGHAGGPVRWYRDRLPGVAPPLTRLRTSARGPSVEQHGIFRTITVRTSEQHRQSTSPTTDGNRRVTSRKQQNKHERGLRRRGDRRSAARG